MISYSSTPSPCAASDPYLYLLVSIAMHAVEIGQATKIMSLLGSDIFITIYSILFITIAFCYYLS